MRYYNCVLNKSRYIFAGVDSSMIVIIWGIQCKGLHLWSSGLLDWKLVVMSQGDNNSIICVLSEGNLAVLGGCESVTA